MLNQVIFLFLVIKILSCYEWATCKIVGNYIKTEKFDFGTSIQEVYYPLYQVDVYYYDGTKQLFNKELNYPIAQLFKNKNDSFHISRQTAEAVIFDTFDNQFVCWKEHNIIFWNSPFPKNANDYYLSLRHIILIMLIVFIFNFGKAIVKECKKTN